ncbi:MAG: Amino acid adenylation [Myxococcales bacterium]|nr:Amino acid adenylation [Myxococcales bacterium]
MKDARIHETIERQAAATPESIAVKFEGQSLSYAELNARANQLARHLRRLGVAPEMLVGIAMERSLEMIISLLGVLKAGAAYVPFDPGYPKDRLAYMIGDARPRLVLTQERLRMALPAEGIAICAVDSAWDEIAGHPGDNLGVGVAAKNLAYVIYTSGSTGRPKGAMNSHEGIANRLQWMQEQYRLTPDDRILQKTPFSFDVSVWELFWPLMYGARLIMAKPGGHQEPRYLIDTIVSEGITTVHFVPPMLAAFLETEGVERCTSLQRVVCSGEALSHELVVRFHQRLDAGLYNLYGPTEASVDVSHWTCEPGGAPVVPIGHPIANLRLHVLDPHLEPVVLGAAGEIHIAGIGLGRGYLARPGLTAERFVPDPLSPEPGGRLYKTGDLGRLRPDGAIEYLGRIDHQVKIRGFRIELGEIEAVLAQHAVVREVIVIAREDTPGDKRLVAYVVCRDGATDSGVLRAHLAAKLPEYMVPSAFVVLDELPLTPNGKIDRQALPAPADDAYQHAEYVAPRTHTERVLAEIWCKVLGIEQVGIHDNFFELGGHSLLIVRLVIRIADKLGVEVPAASVFTRPTIAMQAEQIEDLARPSAMIEAVSGERELTELVTALPESEVIAQLAEWSQVMLTPVPTRSSTAFIGARRELLERLIAQDRIDSHPTRPLARRTSPTAPATFDQKLNWDFHERGNFPSLGIQATPFAIHGRLDVRAMQQAITALVDRQPALRTTFAMHGNRLGQTVQTRGPELEVVDLSSYQPDDRQAQARRLFEAISHPHDLGREVFRAQLVRLEDDAHLLFLVPHHIVVDGFGWEVLDSDLAALYRAFAAGQEPALLPLVLHFNDFCFWQTTLEQRPVGRKQLEFWARAVAGYDGLELAGDRRVMARGAVGTALDTYQIAEVPFALDGADWEAVERLSSRLACTPYTVIATAFFLLLMRWSGRRDACVLSSNFHRNRPGSEAVIGNLVTPYPLRMSSDDNATLEEMVRRCHEAVLVHREHSHVAPSSTIPSWREWSRYNLNYQIDPNRSDQRTQVRDRQRQALDFGSVKLERLGWSAFARQTPHDLALFLLQGAHSARGSLLYNAERFSSELAARAATRLGRLIGAITTAPSDRVADLPGAP